MADRTYTATERRPAEGPSITTLAGLKRETHTAVKQYFAPVVALYNIVASTADLPTVRSWYAGAADGNRSLSPRPATAKKPKQLDELFHDTLKDIYYAEKKILTALPKMAKAAQSDELRAAFEKHQGETEDHVERLERVFEMIDAKPQGKTCDAILGIIEEGQEIMKEYKGSPALDAGLLAAAQEVEHYEISRYGTLKTWAEELGLNDAVQLLDETLQEEKATDETLAGLAESVVNQDAQHAA